MQVALDPAPLLVACRDDAASRLLHFVELRANVCLQASVVQCQARRGACRRDEIRIELGIVHDRGDLFEARDGAGVRR